MSDAGVRDLATGARRRGAVAALVLSALAPLLVYWPTPGDYWVRFDNQVLIRQEPKIRALALEGDARTAAVASIFTTAHGDLYQPLLTFSLAVDYALFGWDRSGFHAHSVLLHLLVTACAFLLAYRLVGAAWASLLAALLVGLHPVMVEAVAWVIHRTLLVTAVWILLGTHAYLSYARDPRRGWWLVIATAAFGLSLMAKAVGSVVVVPFLIDLWLRRRLSVRLLAEKAPLLVLAVFFTWLNLSISRGAAGNVELEGLGLFALGNLPAGFTLSVANIAVPQKLAFFYPARDLWSIVGLRWVAAWAAIGCVVAAALWLWRSGSRGLLIGCVGWLALLAPFLVASSFRDVATADRYVYIASLILVPGLAEAMVRLRPASAAGRRASAAAVLVVIAILGAQARGQARQWFDELELWRAVLSNGRHPVAYGAMGNVYAEREQWFDAVACYQQAVELVEGEYSAEATPVFHVALAKLALQVVASMPTGAPERARYLAAAATGARGGIERWPDHADLYYHLGRAQVELGLGAEALSAFEAATARNPRHYQALTELGIGLDRAGETDSAVQVLRQAVSISRSHPRALEALGDLCERRGDFGPAAELFLRWVVVRPGVPGAHRRFLDAVAAGLEAGQADMVSPWLERYLERFPDSATAGRLRERVARMGGASG